MAITFVGSAENSAANGADVTLTLPGPPVENDLVVVAYAIGDNDNLDFNMAMVTAGYTEVADLFADDTQDCNLGVFWKIMGAMPDTTAQVDGQGGTDAAVAAVCMVFRGVDTVTPMDVAPTTATAINTMHPNPPSIDFLDAAAWTVIVGASGHTLAGAGTYTFPTGYTTNAIDRGADDTSDVTVGIGYRTNPADPEDPGVMTHSGTDSTSFAWCAATLALRVLPSQTFFQTLPATAIGIAGLTALTTFAKTLTATAVGAATLATALLTSVTMAATAVGVATLSRVLTFAQTLAAVAAGVAGMVTEFIAGTSRAVSRLTRISNPILRFYRRT